MPEIEPGRPARPRARRGATAGYAALPPNRDEVLRQYLPLVRRVVQRLAARKPPHIELDDLVSWGIVGLLDAIGKYDPAKEALFSTYAQFRIRGAILDHLRSLDWVPRSVRQKASLIEKITHQLEGRLGRPPTEEEIGEMSLFSLEDLGFGSGEERLKSGQNGDEGEADPLRALLSHERVHLVAEAIQHLPERERIVVTLYYHEELTMKEVGAVLGLTESRVSQLHSQAMLRLKGNLQERFGPRESSEEGS